MRIAPTTLALALLLPACETDVPVAQLHGAVAGDTAALPALPPVQAPWPVVTPLPACGLAAFQVPPLKTEGDVAIRTGGALQVTQRQQILRVEVHQPGTNALDPTATGSLQVELDAGMQLLDQTQLSAGRAAVWVRFLTPGLHQVQLRWGKGQHASVQLQAYDTPLPVWEAEIAPADLDEMMAHPERKTQHPARLRQAGQPWHEGASVRIQGGASLDAAKKSLTFTLAAGDDVDGDRHLTFRAEYLDKTMLRTWLGYQLFRSVTWLPTPRSDFVHLRINSDFYGLMNRVERIGPAFLKAWGRDPHGLLYESDPLETETTYHGNLTPVPVAEYQRLYVAHAGAHGFQGLRDLVEGLLQQPSSEFFRRAPGEVKLDDWLAYAAAMAVLQNHEHVRKNFYVYRDGAASRWEFYPWDLDLTWGHLWSAQADVLDQTVVADAPLEVGLQVPEHDFYNQMYRVLTHPQARLRFRSFVSHIAEVALQPAFLDNRIDSALCRIRPDLLADTRKRATNAEYLGRVQEIRDFAKARLAYIRSQLAVP